MNDEFINCSYNFLPVCHFSTSLMDGVPVGVALLKFVLKLLLI